MSATDWEWQATFDAVDMAVWLMDPQMRIQRCNKASETLFHRKADQVIGKHCWEVVHGTSEPIPECPVRRMRETLHREISELPIGARWLEIAVDPILDGAGACTGIVHTVSDITSHKQTEIELRRVNAELKAALSHVKRLEGILAICMYCHKIRTDAGSWVHLEEYISSRSDARFSHGVCPHCETRFTSDLGIG